MSTKEQRREKEEVSTATTTTSYNTAQAQQEQQHSVNRALDETKNNIRRATDEARKDIPRYTQAANEYQEQTIQTAREIADNFLESQKEIINSLQSAWLPQIDAANRAFVSSWMSPTRRGATSSAGADNSRRSSSRICWTRPTKGRGWWLTRSAAAARSFRSARPGIARRTGLKSTRPLTRCRAFSRSPSCRTIR